MKTCKYFAFPCKFPCNFLFGLELSVAVRFFAFADLFAIILTFGPILTMFLASIKVQPMTPKVFHSGNFTKPGHFLLYPSNRTNATLAEEAILVEAEDKCGVDYRYYLPEIWELSRPILNKALYLLGFAFFLPTLSALAYVVLHKKERVAFFMGFAHVGFVSFAVIISVYGIWFLSDRRLCLLDCFSESLRIQSTFFIGVVIINGMSKAAILLITYLFLKSHFKIPRNTNRQPTPAEELYAYLKELRAARVKPKVKFDLPQDLSKVDWEDIEQLIRKILVTIRLQVADLHKDDPYVHDLIQSGKLQGVKKKQVSAAPTRSSPPPSILRIAQAMVKEGSAGEYKLLKQGTTEKETENRDDVKIILPEPNLRLDDDL